MKNRRIIKFLSVLTESEYALLARYLSSPYFLYRKNLADIFEWLRQFGPEFEISESEENKFRDQLLGKKTSTPQTWNRLLSDLTQEIYKMLSVTHFLEDQRAVDYHAIKALEYRSSDYPFKSSLKKAYPVVPEIWDEISYDYYWLMLELAASDTNQDKHQTKEKYWQTYSDLFEVNAAEYVYKQLKLEVVIKSGEKILKLPELKKNIIFDVDSLIQVAESLEDKHPLIKVYYLLLQAYLQFNSVDRFTDFLDFVLQKDGDAESESPFAPSERLTLFRLGINYCIQQKASSNAKLLIAYEKMVEFLKVAFDEADRKGISDHLFFNLALLFLARKRWESYDNWVKNYSDRLPPNLRNICLQLAEAYRLFFQSDFEKADAKLQTINNRQLRYALRYQSLKVRVAYELYFQQPEEIWLGDQLESRIAAFRSFLNHRSKEQITDTKKQQYLNFIVVLEQIVKASKQSPVLKGQVKSLIQLVATKSPPLASWLIQKINAL